MLLTIRRNSRLCTLLMLLIGFTIVGSALPALCAGLCGDSAVMDQSECSVAFRSFVREGVEGDFIFLLPLLGLISLLGFAPFLEVDSPPPHRPPRYA